MFTMQEICHKSLNNRLDFYIRYNFFFPILKSQKKIGLLLNISDKEPMKSIDVAIWTDNYNSVQIVRV